MKATKEHISLETAKLLKNCRVKNSLVFTNECDFEYLDNEYYSVDLYFREHCILIK